ncbi:MAG: site-2 protease family protein [Candidatus Saccharimonas sp.]
MNIGYILTVFGVILVSMTLHEFMHGFVAYKLGDDTPRLLGRLSLNPLKHIDPFLTLGLPLMIIVIGSITGTALPIFGGAKPVPFNPNNVKYDEWGVALMAAAGPLVNLLLAFISFALVIVLAVPAGSVLGDVLTTSVMVNLGFFAFNILPIPPLDGSRVLYSLAPDFVRRGMEMIERFGLVFIFLIVFLAGGSITWYMTSVINGLVAGFYHIFGM